MRPVQTKGGFKKKVYWLPEGKKYSSILKKSFSDDWFNVYKVLSDLSNDIILTNLELKLARLEV